MWFRILFVFLLLAAPAGNVSSASAQGLQSQAARARTAAADGWAAIKGGRNEDAAKRFADAIAANSREATHYLGAGVAAHLLGQPGKARQMLEQALALAPDLTAASLLLGDVLYRSSDLEGAIRVYEAAARYAPRDAMLLARLEALRKESDVQSAFFQSPGAHFTVLFEGPSDEALADRALEILENAYWQVGSAFQTFPEHVITVVLYTKEQFRDITRSPDWAAAVYDGRIKVPMRGALQRQEELERVLVHEFTHVLVRSLAPKGVPQWLNEGLAMTFERGAADWAAQQLAATPRRLPVAVLADGFGNLSGADATLAYAQSAALTRQLIDLAGTPAVVALLQDIARGTPFSDAFAARVLMSFDAFMAGVQSVR